MDMGLGKTLTSLAWYEQLMSEGKVDNAIIICQSSKYYDWTCDVNKFIPNKHVFCFGGNKKDNLIDKDIKWSDLNASQRHDEIIKSWQKHGGILMLSHSMIYTNEIYITKKGKKAGMEQKKQIPIFDTPQPNTCLIVDESHCYSNIGSQYTKAFVKLAPMFTHLRLLSGTPRGNSNEDLFPQMKAMGYDKVYPEFENLWSFQQKFMVMEKLPKSDRRIVLTSKTDPTLLKYYGYTLETLKEEWDKKTNELFALLRLKSVLIKTNEVHELPEQNFKDVHYYDDSFNYLKVIKDKVYKSKNNMFIFDKPSARYLMARMGSAGFIGKDGVYEQVSTKRVELLRDILLEANEKFVIFYNYDAEYSVIIDMLTKSKIPYYLKNGKKDEHKEFREWVSIDEDDRKPVLLAQYQSGSKAINLQTGGITRTIYYSPTNSYKNYSQSLKRIHRIGQKYPVFYYRIVNDYGGIDKRIMDTIENNEDYDEQMFAKDFE